MLETHVLCVCVSSKVSASLLQTQQEELQEKVSNWDGRPQSLAGRAADDAGDCPHMTCDLTFAYSFLCVPGLLQLTATTHPQTSCRHRCRGAALNTHIV